MMTVSDENTTEKVIQLQWTSNSCLSTVLSPTLFGINTKENKRSCYSLAWISQRSLWIWNYLSRSSKFP